MMEMAFVVLALIVAVLAFATGFGIGFYYASMKTARLLVDAMKASGIDRETAERLVVGLKTPKTEQEA